MSSFHSMKFRQFLEASGQDAGFLSQSHDGQVQGFEDPGIMEHGLMERAASLDGHANLFDNFSKKGCWNDFFVFFQGREHGQPEFQGLGEAVIKLHQLSGFNALADKEVGQRDRSLAVSA